MYKYWLMEMMEAHHRQSFTMQLQHRRLEFSKKKDAVAGLSPRDVKLVGFRKASAANNGVRKSRSLQKQVDRNGASTTPEVR